MSFIYPRLISITRPATNTAIGATGYQGLDPANETLIDSGIPASIQEQKDGRRPSEGLPGDTYARTVWYVYTFRYRFGIIKTRDIVTDDLGNRFQVTGDYDDSLGTRLECERLET